MSDGHQTREEVRRSHARLQGLLEVALAGEELAPGQVTELLEELSASLEELRVAEEELTVQGEQLAASAHAIDAERERYADLFDFAPDGYVETDEMGKVVEANQAAAELLGLPTRLLIGRLLVGFVHADARRAFRRDLSAAVEGGVAGERLFVIEPRDGRSFTAGVTIAPALSRQADTTLVRWLIRDVSERVKLEEEVELLSDEVELLTGLSDVQQLVEGTDPLAATLQGLVEVAHRSLPGCEVGVSLLGRREVEHQVGSSPRARDLDDRQRAAERGPCIEAMEQGRLIRGRPELWDVLGRAPGVEEVVAIPLVIDGGAAGALNVYAGEAPLDEHALRLLSLLAAQAAVALRNARLYTSSAGLAAGLAQALETRGVIERAKGLLMAEQGCGADAAFDLLRRASQRENTKLHDVASRIVEAAEGRGRRDDRT